MKSTSFPAHRSAFVFASFALVGGFLEAYTYILHGGVFCNAQTGNLVLFFIDAANGEWQEASHYLYSLLAYIAGILVSAALPLLLKRFSHAAVTAFEIAALAALAFLPAEAPDFYTYVSVSFLCALQYNTFTECRGAKLATTFCTNNLRQAVLGVFDAAKNRDGAALRFVAERLSKRSEELKLLILVSDGQPADSGYYGTAAEEDLRGIRQEYRRKGLLFVAAAIGDDKENIERIYGDSFLDITDLNQLPVKLTQVVKRFLRV